MQILGIDIGGSGIKGAIVDTKKAELVTSRKRYATPSPSTPAAVARKVARLARHFDWQGPLGCGFPAVVQNGVVKSAANIHKDWIGTNATQLFAEASGCRTTVLNDADAAGMAEVRFGAGKDRPGVILLITIGTGLGTVLFVDGVLVPNLELGHIEIRGKDAEKRASDATRKEKDLSWREWGERFDEYLHVMDQLTNPDLIILGGGAVKKLHKYRDYLTVSTDLVAAEFLNEAGIVGAALAAEQRLV
jgi:polyphosphate glucokinase